MPQTLLLTALSVDRPGLVERIAATLAEHGGNWLGSRMCRLGGHFVGMIQIRIANESVAPLQQSLAALAAEGLRVEVNEGTDITEAADWTPVRIEVVGQDRPGIVRALAARLASIGANVEDFTSEVISAPMSGESLFKAQAVVRPPSDTDEAALRQALEDLGDDLMVEILSPLTEPVWRS